MNEIENEIAQAAQCFKDGDAFHDLGLYTLSCRYYGYAFIHKQKARRLKRDLDRRLYNA